MGPPSPQLPPELLNEEEKAVALESDLDTKPAALPAAELDHDDSSLDGSQMDMSESDIDSDEGDTRAAIRKPKSGVMDMDWLDCDSSDDGSQSDDSSDGEESDDDEEFEDDLR